MLFDIGAGVDCFIRLIFTDYIVLQNKEAVTGWGIILKGK